MIKINAESDVPIYSQLAEQIRNDIRSRNLPTGTLLPPDRVYCEKLNISHMTVKKAIDLLVSEGLLTRKKGVGTFVASPKIRQELFSLAGFTGDNARHGRKIDSRVLRVGVQKAPDKVAARMHLRENANVIVLARLRMVNDEPVALETAYLNHDDPRCAPIMSFDFSKESLYRVLKEVCGITLEYAKETIEVAYGSRESNQHLCSALDTPMFNLERISYDTDGCAVEFVESIYRADRYTFSATLIAP